MNDDDLDGLIAELTSEGFIEPVFDENGEVMVKIVPRADSPLWQEHLKAVDADIEALIELGYAEISGVNEDGVPTYARTELGEKILNEEA